MRLSVLSQFKESASVYDDILAGTILLYFSYRRHILALASGQSEQQCCVYIFIFYEALWLKAGFYGFVDAPKRRNNLRVSLGACDKLHQHYNKSKKSS